MNRSLTLDKHVHILHKIQLKIYLCLYVHIYNFELYCLYSRREGVLTSNEVTRNDEKS